MQLIFPLPPSSDKLFFFSISYPAVPYNFSGIRTKSP
jgi:hypothetical protein